MCSTELTLISARSTAWLRQARIVLIANRLVEGDQVGLMNRPTHPL
jgi:hypothetical protein